MSEVIRIPSNTVPIAMAFTSNYVVPAATTILSVLKNSQAEDTFHFCCLLTEDLPEEIIKSIQDLVGEKALLSFINMAGRVEGIHVDEKYTVAASYRLLLADLVPEYDKILYMDCDFIVQNNIAKLYHELDLDKYYMAGVFEATLPEQMLHLNEIGCLAGQYINSGFLLMNLKRLREDNMIPKFMEASKNDALEFPDQDVINMLCKGQLLGLAPFWNSIRTFMLPQYKEIFLRYYTEQDWQDVQKRGNVHYTGPKPWRSFSVSFDIWWRYYKHLPKSIKKLMSIDRKIKFIAFIYRSTIGKSVLDTTRNVFRQLKKNKK